MLPPVKIEAGVGTVQQYRVSLEPISISRIELKQTKARSDSARIVLLSLRPLEVDRK